MTSCRLLLFTLWIDLHRFRLVDSLNLILSRNRLAGMTPDQIVAFVLALAGPPPMDPLVPLIASGGADPRYPVVAAPCPGPLAPYEVEGRTVACGRVRLPENHDDPVGRRIDLTFMELKSHSQAPTADPVVYLHGGPGSGVVRNPILITRFLNDIRDRRDIIAFDQRGVDTSGRPGVALLCGGSQPGHPGRRHRRRRVGGRDDRAGPPGGARLPGRDRRERGGHLDREHASKLARRAGADEGAGA